MCMQDLAIARNVTWRRIIPAANPNGVGSDIPPNPSRVGLIVTDISSATVVEVQLGGPGGALVNSEANITLGERIVSGWVGPPGQPYQFASVPLYAASVPAATQVWEAVLDPGIGLAVERLATELRNNQG